MSDGLLSPAELLGLGFRQVGENVRLSRRASIYGAERITIGSNVRIDDFCILSAGAGGIRLGDYIHIAAFALLIGSGEIVVGDFSGISSRACIYSSSDDYSGAALTNPTVPDAYKNVHNAPVTIGRHVIIGSGSVVLPGTNLGDGCAIGALSLVRGDTEPFGIYAGVPAVRRSERKRDLLDHEKAFAQARSQQGASF